MSLIQADMITRQCLRIECSNTFEVSPRRKTKKKYCCPLCGVRNNPAYRRNNQLIDTCEFYISLGFTPAQVYDDFIKDYMTVESFVKALERRPEQRRMLQIFRAWGYSSGLLSSKKSVRLAKSA